MQASKSHVIPQKVGNNADQLGCRMVWFMSWAQRLGDMEHKAACRPEAAPTDNVSKKFSVQPVDVVLVCSSDNWGDLG